MTEHDDGICDEPSILLPRSVVEQYERTLKFYANPKNWADDTWGVRSILHGFTGRGKKRGGYGKPELPAALALNQKVVKLR